MDTSKQQPTAELLGQWDDEEMLDSIHPIDLSQVTLTLRMETPKSKKYLAMLKIWKPLTKKKAMMMSTRVIWCKTIDLETISVLLCSRMYLMKTLIRCVPVLVGVY
ncbi:unnamed protein product [Absidia cylindrospora]